ncbi:MAG: ATP-dependent helicase HrpB [Myxococcota bacterium]
MAIDKISGAGASPPVPVADAGKEKFGKVLSAARLANPQQVARTGQLEPCAPSKAQPARSLKAAEVLDQVSAAQKRLDQVLAMAQSGKTFTPAELLAMQAHVYRASQELDLAGKVVEKATNGVKQILQTQV